MSSIKPIAIVTGGTRRIGRAISIQLARVGYDVVVNFLDDERSAAETCGEIERLGGRAIPVRANVADPREVDGLVASAARAGVIRALVNNVGPFIRKPLLETTSGEWRATIDANLNSAFFMSTALLPRMQARGGSIVNVGLSTTHSVRAGPNVAAYAVAKTGLQVLTKSLAAEVAQFGVRVNSVSPGLIDTGDLSQEEREWMSRRVPAGRLGTPDEVAKAVCFLLSDDALYVNGADIAVSGGWDWTGRSVADDLGMPNFVASGLRMIAGSAVDHPE